MTLCQCCGLAEAIGTYHIRPNVGRIVELRLDEECFRALRSHSVIYVKPNAPGGG